MPAGLLLSFSPFLIRPAVPVCWDLHMYIYVCAFVCVCVCVLFVCVYLAPPDNFFVLFIQDLSIEESPSLCRQRERKPEGRDPGEVPSHTSRPGYQNHKDVVNLAVLKLARWTQATAARQLALISVHCDLLLPPAIPLRPARLQQPLPQLSLLPRAQLRVSTCPVIPQKCPLLFRRALPPEPTQQKAAGGQDSHVIAPLIFR